jgi:hypothetical protein
MNGTKRPTDISWTCKSRRMTSEKDQTDQQQDVVSSTTLTTTTTMTSQTAETVGTTGTTEDKRTESQNEDEVCIESVIARFGAMDYDDTGKQAPRLLVHLLSAFQTKKIVEEDSLVRSTMLAELKAFRRTIKERMAGEFYWHAAKDLQYCHDWVLRWIMARWYCKAKRVEDLPVWYQTCLKLANDSSQGNGLRLVELLILEVVCGD